VRTNPAPPTGSGVIYAEDHCGLRWPLTFQAIGWPILLIAASVVFFVDGNPILAYLASVALAGALFAIVATVISRPIGIRITSDGISIGGVRRRQHSPRTGGVPPATAQRKQVFSCPRAAVRNVEVVTGRDRMKELGRYRSDHGRLRLGTLWAPFMTGALVMQVDLAEASVPESRPPDTQRHWFRASRPDSYADSPTWYAPTRQVVELRHVLSVLAAAPQTVDDGGRADRQHAD
jgi:hypothetical protein